MFRPLRRRRGAAVGWLAALLLVVCTALVLAASRSGWLDAPRTLVADARFALATRPPVTGTVLVAIDPTGLREIDTWPWPRSVHAALIERLDALGAAEIHFDVDFSSASNPHDDGALERALAAADALVTLAGHAQATPHGMVERLPLPRFAAHAQVASVNVRPGPDGLTRRAERGRLLGGLPTPSLASLLAEMPPAPDAFPIDFAIDARAVPQVSVARVLDGSVDPGLIEGARVVVGATAVELGDMLSVPRYGVLPGALVQVLAAETLAQDRVAASLDRTWWRGWRAWWIGPVIAGAIGLALLLAMAGGAIGLGHAASALVILLAALGIADATLFVDRALLVPSVEIALVLLAAMGCCTLEEIGRRRAHAVLEAARAENARRVLDRVVSDNFDAIVVLGEDGTVHRASSVARELSLSLFGDDLSRGTLDGLDAELRAHLMHPARLLRRGEWRALGTLSATRTDLAGRTRHLEYVLTPSRTSLVGERGSSVIVTLTMRDVTEREAARERMEWLATHDEPSGALKPAALRGLMDAAIRAGTSERGELVAVDLRRFDVVRRTLGRSKADDLLARVVRSVAATHGVRGVARAGDGEFVVWLSGVSDAAGSVRRAVREGLGRATASAARMAVPTGTVALADHSSAAEAMEAASIAREHAVARGDAVVPHEPAMTEAARRRLRQEADLPGAIADDALDVHYQPKVDLATGRPVGVEALVRWTHPDLGFVPPDEFVAVAEASGCIADLGAWVAERACRDILPLGGSSGPLHLGVNVSPQQFLQSDVSAMVADVLARTGFPADRLELEITESLAVKDPGMVRRALAEWRARGVSVALDDFGTGYAQLGMLRELPLDWIKLDRSLIAPLPAAKSTSLVAAALTIAQGHGLRTVAEGIEDARTATLLRGAGCDVGQGYHWSRPMPIHALREWLGERSVPEMAHARQ